MRGRYEVEDLLKLRASPLVGKPAGLPPKEEWMGPADSRPRTATTRNKLDDTFQTEGFQKRPTLLDSARRSTTDPERIHLGPPRNSFASSNAARGRNGTHERTKTNDDPDQKFSDRRSGTYVGPNGKFGARAEHDNIDAEHPRRRNDDGDADGRARREHDRPRWANRDTQLDDERVDEGVLRNQRDTYSRAKFDQPWTRREKNQEVDHDSPAWRRGQRDRDFERNDTEPEWVDSVDALEPAKAHTHADFLQWMEQMKSKNSAEEKPSQPEMVQKELAATPIERPPPRVVSDSSASVDKFFAKFEGPKAAEGSQTTSKPTKSRFASIFGAKDEPKQDDQSPTTNMVPAPPPAELEQPLFAAKVDPEKKANDAAFAKLLEMLNKNQSASTPPATQIPSTRSPLNVAELASTRSPDLGVVASVQPRSNRTPTQSHTPNLSLDRLIESRSPAQHTQREQPVLPKAGPQDLLDLLRRSNIQEKQHQPQQQSIYPPHQTQRMPAHLPPGLVSFPINDGEQHGPPLINTRRENPRSIFDDPAFQGYRSEQEYQQRNPGPVDQGGLGGLFAAMNNRNYLSNAQQEQRPAPTQSAHNPPPGLQRPPGLEQGARPPPGWPTNTQPRQAQSQPLPNVPQQYHNQAPFSHQQQNSRQMAPPQRKPTGELSLPPGYSGIPPGFAPPLNYTSPTSPDPGVQYATRGNYGLSDRDRMERERQQQNAFATMYGNGNGTRGGNGGMQLPPGFSR